MRILAVTLLVLATAACDLAPIADPPATERPVDLTVADLVGPWRNDQRDGSITFDAGGRFEARNNTSEEHATMVGAL
jgi:hypothetical protein